jgi:hypothetical protein
MWKRHAGFDVVTYTGNGATKNDGGRYVPHNLSKTPEMMWVKRRNSSQSWQVWHKGLNGGTNSGEYFLELNSSNAESGSSSSEIWADSTPTATHFILGDNSTTNNSNGTYIAMLFASVDGISKVGYYAGSGSTQTITTGFQPRFLIVKVIDNTLPWYVLDTTRGWASGNDTYLQINDSAVQVTNFDFGAPTSTGFTMVGGAAANNESGLNYIYYAHA